MLRTMFMNVITKILMILIVISCLTSFTLVSGEAARWITKLEIKENGTGKVISEGTPLLSGGLYVVHVNITIPMKADIEVLAYTQLEWDGQHALWKVMEDPAGAVKPFGPTDQWISFVPKDKDIKLVLDVQGRVPSKITIKSIDGLTLHIKTPIQPILLQVKDGSRLDYFEKQVIDANIAAFDTKLQQKKVFLQEIRNEADEKWLSLTLSVVSYSESLAAKGFTDMASEILEFMPSSRDSVPLKPVEKNVFIANIPYVGMGILGLLATIGLFQWSKTQGKSSAYEYILKEQVKKLEVLQVRGERVDPRFASELGELKEAIKKVLEG